MRKRSLSLILIPALILLTLALAGCNRERPAPTPVGPTAAPKTGAASPTPPGAAVTKVVLPGQTPQAAGAATPVPLTPRAPLPSTPVPVATSAPTAVQPAPAPAGGETIYIVQRGDTLAKIAAKYGVTVKQIVDLNSITNPNLISTGQKLRIPAAAGAATPTGGQTGAPKTYTVRAGDTLVAIATKYGVTVQAIQQLNNLASPDQIYTGQVLKIP
ncbi:MAG: peptidoglycan-N-acetylglucosamine deacetylase [Chloroflexota bacterium]|nr:peptidoglycan-N-acetylglucosamine deacetylase [Chloroflexota bacterium]